MLNDNIFLQDTTPLEFYLSQNYPNPFSKKTTIKYCVAYKTNVQITVYNAEGEEIDNIVNEEKLPGTYEVEFNTSKYQKENNKLPDGYYLYKMFAGNFSSDKKWLCKNSLESKSSKKSIFSFLSLLLIFSQFCLAQQHQNNYVSPPDSLNHSLPGISEYTDNNGGFISLEFSNINPEWFNIPVMNIKEFLTTDKPVIKITKDGGTNWGIIKSLNDLSLPDSMFRMVLNNADNIILQGLHGSLIILNSAPIRIVIISTGREQRQNGFYFNNDSTLHIIGDFKVVVQIINDYSLEKKGTAVDAASEYILLQNYPNPFNPSTKISWQSSAGSHQTLKIFDLLGNEVATLVDEYKPAGRYEAEFNASTIISGVYFYQLKAGEFIQTKKMILLK